MQNAYLDQPAETLLRALEQAGRTPEKPLLYACLERSDEIAPALLDWLDADLEDDPDWPDEDPRWYRGIHAGQILAAARDERVLPRFAEVLRDEKHENLRDWFYAAMGHLGPASVETYLGVLRDARAGVWGRILASSVLADIARQHPDERERVVEALRARLPLVDAEGRFVTPPPTSDDHVELWSAVACDLAELRDRASRPRVVALYRADLIDEMLMGDEADYLAIFDEDPRPARPFDLIRSYHPRR
jgi:hypothetical protein